MTRKRFVKLLMARGEPRNKAQTIAHLYNLRKIPYRTAYKDYLIRSGVIKAFVRMGEQARTASETICRLARSLDALKQGLVISNEHKRIY